mgnify:CR=1 FL=1
MYLMPLLSVITGGVKKMPKSLNVSAGDRFGYWTVTTGCIVRTGVRGLRSVECECECGLIRTVEVFNLVNGRSAGCTDCVRNNTYKVRSNGFDSRWRADRIRRKYIRSASSRGIDFELSLEDVEWMIRSNYWYCDSPPANTYSEGPRESSFMYMGIDRKINSLGYSKDNCIPCCAVCNRAKMNMTSLEFVALCLRVAENNIIDLPSEFEKEVDEDAPLLKYAEREKL